MSKLLRTLALFALLVAMGTLCNFAACLIDTPAMRQNAAQGARMLADQGSQPELVGGFSSARLDNFTAVLILKTAAYTGPESLPMRALGGMRTDMLAPEGADLWNQWYAFCEVADGSQSPTGVGLSYSRYWHGTMLPLRLLLCVLNLSNIQMLLYFAQLALLLLTALLMQRRGLTRLLPGFAAAYFLMMPGAMGVCLQYAPVSLITLAACCAVLAWHDQLHCAVGLPGFFALVGLVTNYFDLLTFPLVSLGFPLVLSLCIRLCGESPDTRGLPRLILHAIACCAAWGVGYGGMWAIKWLFTALFLGPQWLAGVGEQAMLRLSSGGGEGLAARLDAMRLNIAVISDKTAYRLLLPFVAMLTAACTAFRIGRLRRDGFGTRFDFRVLALLIPAALPFAWMLVMANHVADHYYYTYRILAFAALAAYALLAYALAPDKKKT